MSYVDGFVVAVPKANIEAYKTLANLCATIWMEHGALSCAECIGDDVPYGELTSFPRAVMAREDEVVVFSWITYASRQERDRIVKRLRELGIEIGIHFPYPIHLMEAYRFLGLGPGTLPTTEKAARELFSLPMHPGLGDQDIRAVIKALKETLS